MPIHFITNFRMFKNKEQLKKYTSTKIKKQKKGIMLKKFVQVWNVYNIRWLNFVFKFKSLLVLSIIHNM